MADTISIILPARNAAASLRTLLPETIVVNDGSDDDTLDVCKELAARVISHPYPKGTLRTFASFAVKCRF